VAKNASSFLRSVEAHRIFRHDEVDHELAFALIVASLSQLSIARAFRLLRLDVVDEVDKRVESGVAQVEERILNVFYPSFQLGFWKVVTGLAGTIDLQERAIDLVIADLKTAGAHVRHVAISTGDARTGMHALVPHLELRMARFDQAGATIGVVPFFDFLL